MTDPSHDPAALPPEANGASAAESKPRHGRGWKRNVAFATVFLVVGALVTAAILALLMNIFQKKEEAQHRYQQVVNVDEKTYDPAVWGQNFPLQYQGWKDTSKMPEDKKVAQTPSADDPRDSKAQSKLQQDPRLVTMWNGYAFAVEYNEPRGHAHMLDDQRYVKRVTQFKQPGTCLNCHASMPEVYDKLGNGDQQAGFDAMNKMTYTDATKLAEHPVGCIDCHDPKTMALRVTRPAFMTGIKNYMASKGVENYDVNKDATQAQMRTYVCAQCHVEYYFKGEGKTLTFPWSKGLTVDDAEAYYDEIGFTDFKHGLTGANILKAQHPDFETFSQGIHAQNGVTCADCHMPYKRSGASKYSDHQVRSPMVDNATINSSCLTCHHATEDQMRERVGKIQDTYNQARNVAGDALDALIKDTEKAKAEGVPQDRIDKANNYQRKAQFFYDYSVSENSHGFHAPQYSLRILNDVTNNARLGQLALAGQEVPDPPKPNLPQTPVPSSTPTGASPSSAPSTPAAPTPTPSR